MRIQYASDLHLEFQQNMKFLKMNPLMPKGDILVLAGDIVPFAVMEKQADFFNYLSDNFETTYWIPGNHEYYSFDIATKSGVVNEKIRSNVFLVNNTTIQQESVNLIFSTLWSKISDINAWYIERGLSDFHVIKNNGSRFSVAHYNELHNDSLSFITNELKKTDKSPSVVVTHHIPTLFNYPKKYKGSILNEAFAVELFNLIEEYGPDFWIYGHSHFNTSDFIIGKTQLCTNQLGYIENNEHQLFSLSKSIVL